MAFDGDRLRMEVAYVLYLDMVGYSRLSLDEQFRVVGDLGRLVRGTEEFTRHSAGNGLLCLDTGDGMALVFFGDPQSPIRCACEISAALGATPLLPVRIGLHSGPVVRRHDINGRGNVSGAGVDVAQRVMDCGDAGHILLSRSYADLLRPLEIWAAHLHDLGEMTVKHGVQLPLVNFHRADCGCPDPPTRLPPPPAPMSDAPTNLPFWRTDQFVGRAAALARVHLLLQAAAPVVLVGLSGLGKTQLALQYAHLHPLDYPGGVFWVNAADSGHLKDDFATLGRSFFDIPEGLSTESCVARLRDRLHRLTRPALLIFDNVTEETDLSLLPDSPQCRLLLTTQKKHLAPPGFALIELPKLEPDAALAMLHADGPDDDPGAARRIADDLGRLPIALALVAQHRARLRLGCADYHRRFLAPAATTPPSEQNLLHTLERAREKFVAATGHKGRLYETIERSYQDLGPAARLALGAAACFAPAAVGRALLRDVLGPEEPDASWEEALADLADASLISEDEPPADPLADPLAEPPSEPADTPRLRLHELVRLFARMQLPEAQRLAHLVRLAAALTERLRQANEALDWRGIRPEMAHLSAAIAGTRQQELWESLHPLLNVSCKYLILQRDFPGAESHLEEGLDIVERLYGPAHESRAGMLLLRAEVDHGKGDAASALRNVRAALRVARRACAPESDRLADYFAMMGYVLKEKGQFRRAQMFYQKTLDLCLLRSGPDHLTVTFCLNNLAMALAKLGDLEAAEARLREALAAEQRRETPTGPTAAMSVYWNNLGIVLGEQGRWPEALACHEDALRNNRRIHGPRHTDVASSFYYSAAAHEALHQLPQARAHYQGALELYQKLYGDDNWRSDIVRAKLAGL